MAQRGESCVHCLLSLLPRMHANKEAQCTLAVLFLLQGDCHLYRPARWLPCVLPAEAAEPAHTASHLFTLFHPSSPPLPTTVKCKYVEPVRVVAARTGLAGLQGSPRLREDRHAPHAVPGALAASCRRLLAARSPFNPENEQSQLFSDYFAENLVATNLRKTGFRNSGRFKRL